MTCFNARCMGACCSRNTERSLIRLLCLPRAQLSISECCHAPQQCRSRLQKVQFGADSCVSRLTLPAEPSAHAGKCLFAGALQAGTMQGFFKLIEQFRCAMPHVNSKSEVPGVVPAQHNTPHASCPCSQFAAEAVTKTCPCEAGLRMSQPIVDWQAWPWC